MNRLYSVQSQNNSFVDKLDFLKSFSTPKLEVSSFSLSDNHKMHKEKGKSLRRNFCITFKLVQAGIVYVCVL